MPENISSRCVVLVSNDTYFQKAIQTISQLRTVGNYYQTIVLVTDENSLNILEKQSDFQAYLTQYSITIKTFENIDLTYILEKIRQETFNESNRGQRELTKTFQWHKIHVFDTYFKQWKNIFYLDAGMSIYNPIDPFWEILQENEGVLLAHSDTYPEKNTNYGGQFKTKSYPEIFQQLKEEIDLSGDHFQSGILLFHSEIIHDNTKNDIINYSNKYPISRTNEQAIMNVYFNGIHKMWKPMPTFWKKTYTYDFMNRDNLQLNEYIITRYDRRYF